MSVAVDFDQETIVLVGWSPRHRRMVACEYVQHDRAVGFISRIVGPAYFAPWTDGMAAPDFADPFNRGAMRQLAELPWFARNVLLKVAIVARLRPLQRLLGSPDGAWPY